VTVAAASAVPSAVALATSLPASPLARLVVRLACLQQTGLQLPGGIIMLPVMKAGGGRRWASATAPEAVARIRRLARSWR